MRKKSKKIADASDCLPKKPARYNRSLVMLELGLVSEDRSDDSKRIAGAQIEAFKRGLEFIRKNI